MVLLVNYLIFLIFEISFKFMMLKLSSLFKVYTVLVTLNKLHLAFSFDLSNQGIQSPQCTKLCQHYSNAEDLGCKCDYGISTTSIAIRNVITSDNQQPSILQTHNNHIVSSFPHQYTVRQYLNSPSFQGIAKHHFTTKALDNLYNMKEYRNQRNKNNNDQPMGSYPINMNDLVSGLSSLLIIKKRYGDFDYGVELPWEVIGKDTKLSEDQQKKVFRYGR